MVLYYYFLAYTYASKFQTDTSDEMINYPSFCSNDYNVCFRPSLERTGEVSNEIHFVRHNSENELVESFKNLSRQLTDDALKFDYFTRCLINHTDIVLKELFNSFYIELNEKYDKLIRDTPCTSSQAYNMTKLITEEMLENDVNYYNWFILYLENSLGLQDALKSVLESIIFLENNEIIDFLSDENNLKTKRMIEIMNGIFTLVCEATRNRSKEIFEIYLEFVRLKFIYKIKEVYKPNN